MSTSAADAAYMAKGERIVTKAEERRVIIASSVGTVFVVPVSVARPRYTRNPHQ